MFIRHIVAALIFFCLLPSLAHAQCATVFPKPTLNSQITTNFADNTTGQILPLSARTVTTNEVASWQQGTTVNAQVGTTYTVLGDLSGSSDNGKLIVFSNASAVAVTLPAPTSSVGFCPFSFVAQNTGTGTVTITPSSGQIAGAATLVLTTGQWAQITADGTNWRATLNIAGTPGNPLAPVVFGGSGSGQTTTGTINGSSTTLTLGSALDFQNNQGITVNHAGTAFSLPQITGLTSTPTNCGSCTSVYTYYVSTCDQHGGYGAYVSLTTAANGPDLPGPATYNTVSWTSAQTCFLVWRQLGGFTTFLTSTTATSFLDQFQIGNTPPVPFWVTAAPPAVAAADWLVTTISSGAGTTTLTLAAAAATGVAGGTVLHDDTTAWGNWLTALNAGCGNGIIGTPNAIIRTTASAATQLSCSNIIIDGNGATIKPAGATLVIGQFQYQLATAGLTNVGASTTVYCMIGKSLAAVGSNVGFSAPGFADLTMPSPGSTYDFESPVSRVTASTIQLRDACPINFYDFVEKALLAGTTINAGDTVNITFTSTGITGSPVTATYTVQNGDNLQALVDGLAIAINTNTNLQNANINAWREIQLADNTVYIGWPHNDIATVTFSKSVTGTGNETITLSQVTNYTSGNGITHQSNVTFRNWIVDGSNVVAGDGGDAYYGIYFQGLRDSAVDNLTVANFRSSSGFVAVFGYNNRFTNIRETHSGNGGYFALNFGDQTRAVLNNISSELSNGFAIGLVSDSWLEATNIQINGTQARCFKAAASAQVTVTNLFTNACGTTGIGLTLGSTYMQFYGPAAMGGLCSFTSANGEGVWMSNDFDRWNNFFGGYFLGACTTGVSATIDILVSATDLNNNFWGTKFGTSQNNGNAVFH